MESSKWVQKHRRKMMNKINFIIQTSDYTCCERAKLSKNNSNKKTPICTHRIIRLKHLGFIDGSRTTHSGSLLQIPSFVRIGGAELVGYWPHLLSSLSAPLRGRFTHVAKNTSQHTASRHTQPQKESNTPWAPPKKQKNKKTSLG